MKVTSRSEVLNATLVGVALLCGAAILLHPMAAVGLFAVLLILITIAWEAHEDKEIGIFLVTLSVEAGCGFLIAMFFAIEAVVPGTLGSFITMAVMLGVSGLSNRL